MAEPPFEPPTTPPSEGAVEPERRCPRCEAPYDRYQEYCLECGLRLVPLPGTYVRREIWSRDSPIWLWAALAALLLVALVAGAIVAVAATREDEPGGSPVVTAGSGTTDTIGTLDTAPTLTFGTTAPTTTIPPTTTLPPTTTIQPTTTLPTTTTTPTTTGGSGTIISWPTSRDGYTVILRSTRTSEGRGEADAAAQRAINAGLPEVGVLNSSDYSSLNPGYYATFTGIYDSQREAENALPRARSAGFPLAYVRRVAD
ncbi:MAG: hypothetical protein ACRDOG_01575 [Gaiellaceae bacterium]